MTTKLLSVIYLFILFFIYFFIFCITLNTVSIKQGLPVIYTYLCTILMGPHSPWRALTWTPVCGQCHTWWWMHRKSVCVQCGGSEEVSRVEIGPQSVFFLLHGGLELLCLRRKQSLNKLNTVLTNNAFYPSAYISHMVGWVKLEVW